MTTEAPASAVSAFTQQTPEEISTVSTVLEDSGYFPAEARIAYLGLIDPPRGPGRREAQADRCFRVFVLNTTEGTSRDVVVSATQQKVLFGNGDRTPPSTASCL